MPTVSWLASARKLLSGEESHRIPAFTGMEALCAMAPSSGFIPADNTDPNLVNAWGIDFNPFGEVWFADNGTGVATLYAGNGKPQPTRLVMQIPPPANNPGGKGMPTGIALNITPGFVMTQSSASGPARFLFATEDGVIAGWSVDVDVTHAIRVIDNSVKTGAVYKGLTLSAGGNGRLLYAADFHNNRIGT